MQSPQSRSCLAGQRSSAHQPNFGPALPSLDRQPTAPTFPVTEPSLFTSSCHTFAVHLPAVSSHRAPPDPCRRSRIKQILNCQDRSPSLHSFSHLEHLIGFCGTWPSKHSFHLVGLLLEFDCTQRLSLTRASNPESKPDVMTPLAHRLGLDTFAVLGAS